MIPRGLGIVFSAALLFVACARVSDPSVLAPSTPSEPSEMGAPAIVVVGPAETPAASASNPPIIREVKNARLSANDHDADEAALPAEWAALAPPSLPYVEAMRSAHAARDSVFALKLPHAQRGLDAGADDAEKAWFSRTLVLAEHADRFFAAAYVAEDAGAGDRVEAISEAAALTAAVEARIVNAGYGVLPGPWKSDPLVHASFEDVDVGPARRLHDAAHALATRCVAVAATFDVKTKAEARCEELTGTALFVANGAVHDAGASACACNPGDPLCTGTAWCH